jgi:hypothetical protein
MNALATRSIAEILLHLGASTLGDADEWTPRLLADAHRRIDTFLATHPATKPIKHAVHKPCGYAR